jgi:predicted PurR-regulated permease PerM
MTTQVPNNLNIYSRLNPLLSYLSKQRENNKFIKSVEISATFLLISFFTFFAIKPTLLTISQLVGDIKAKEILVKEFKTKINNVIISQDLFSQVQEKFALVESSLPTSPRFHQAASQIVGLTEKNQVYLDKINYSLSDSNYYSTSISTSSSFLSATSLLSGLLQNRRLFQIDQISFSLEKDTGNKTININLPLKIYYWPKNVQN